MKGWWFPFDLLRLHSLPLSLTSFSTSLIPCGTFYLAKATAPRRSALQIHSLLMCGGVLCVQTMAQRPVLGICNEHTAVDTYNCTVYRGLYKSHESVCTDSWLGGKNHLPHWELNLHLLCLAFTSFRQDTLLTSHWFTQLVIDQVYSVSELLSMSHEYLSESCSSCSVGQVISITLCSRSSMAVWYLFCLSTITLFGLDPHNSGLITFTAIAILGSSG